MNRPAPDALEILVNLIRQQRFTDSIQLLEERGIVTEQAQLFLLTAIGGGR